MAAYSFKSSGITSTDPRLIREVTPIPAGIKTPIDLGTGRSGIFQMNFNPVDQIADNLKNLILTNWGERLGNFYYGANIRPLTTELTAQQDFDAEAMRRIQTAVGNFMPFVELDSFNSSFDSSIVAGSTIGADGLSMVSLTVRYNIPQLRISGKSLDVTLYCIG
tara:strand:- start:70 stop:561 length:492 start_codon:yes stop_codon:yes gene_type:complete